MKSLAIETIQMKTKVCESFGIYLSKMFPDEKVKEVAYRYDCDTNEEYADITYQNGYTKSANISCDSGLAIIADVCKALY